MRWFSLIVTPAIFLIWVVLFAVSIIGVTNGFILFGGNAHAVRELTEDLHQRSRHALLVGADLERGAGQQFAGATPLPPLAAIGAPAPAGATRASARRRPCPGSLAACR